MKYVLFSGLWLGIITMASPSDAQFSTFPGNSENCSDLCLKLELQSGAGSSYDSFGLNNSSSGGSNLRWQMSITWRPNAPEVTQAEAERVKQRLEDNRSLMVALAEAIAQDKPELARGIAIILAPRLNYSDPKKLIAEMKEGTVNIGVATIKLE